MGRHWDREMNWRESASSMLPAIFLLWISLRYFSSKMRNAPLYWFPLALGGLQETVLLISRISFVMLHLCALKIFWSEYKKAPALFCTANTGCLSVTPKLKWDFTDHFHYNLCWHPSSNAPQRAEIWETMEIFIILTVQFWELCRICLCNRGKKMHRCFPKTVPLHFS